jgi:hypothetical protein
MLASLRQNVKPGMLSRRERGWRQFKRQQKSILFPTSQSMLTPCQREIKKQLATKFFLLLCAASLNILQNVLYSGLTRMLRALMRLHPAAGRLPLTVDPRKGELEHRVQRRH